MVTQKPLRLEPAVNEHAAIEIGLNAAIVSIHDNNPQILTVSGTGSGTERDSLPYGPFAPLRHRTLETGLRSWVREQTGLGIGYVEQLYTFGDRGRHARPGDLSPHVVSIGYVALIRFSDTEELTGGRWWDWYSFLPWEDWRDGKPAILEHEIEPRLRRWIAGSKSRRGRYSPFPSADRLRMCFGLDGVGWDEEKVLERYELLYEAGLVVEAKLDDRAAADQWGALPEFGRPMRYDHRRILATAMSRLRAKIKYRPVIFELMPGEFTLFELQRTVEAILGSHLHKQNFRRLVENGGLVEATEEVRANTGGRPAKLFRFRREVLLERPAPGVRVHPLRV